MSPTLHRLRAALALAAVTAVFPVLAQSADARTGYPSRPVRMVVPFGAGSGPDLRAREIGQKLAEQWGHPVIVENRPGAGGQLAMEQVARAAPDGYTLVMAGQSAVAIAPHLGKLRYDPLKDFAPVSRTSRGAIILVANAGLPVSTVAELASYAKAHPGRLNAASWGSATITHLALELFNRSAGITIGHVPYKAASQAISELVAGEVQLAFEFYVAVAPHLKSGRLRALAVSGRERLAALPDVPTFTEAGLRDMEPVSGWQGVAAPAGTPRAIVETVRTAVARAMASPELRASYVASGFEAVSDTPEEFSAFIRDEHARWGKLIGEAGIRE